MTQSPCCALLEQLAATHGEVLPLDAAMALIAADENPDLVPREVEAQLDGLAKGLYIPEDAPVYQKVARLNYHLFDGLGFIGDEDDYTHPDNSCLDRVIARRRGLPILLSGLAIEVARRRGFVLDPIAFPGHFLIAPREAEPVFFLDPFRGGQVVSEKALRERLKRLLQRVALPDEWANATAQVSARRTVIRMNDNLKRAWLERGRPEGALRAVRRNLAIAADRPQEQRDLGLVMARLGRLDDAVEALERYVASVPFAPDNLQILKMLEDLKEER